MPRIGHQNRLHKASGQAFVALGGKRHYLGKYGTEESKNAYRIALLEYGRRARRATSRAHFICPSFDSN